MFSKDGPALNPDGSCALGAATRPPRVRRIGLGPALLSAAVLTFGVFALASGGVSGMHAAFHSAAPAKAGANHALGSQPLAFEPNHGQSDARVRFLTHGHGYSVFFTSQGPVLTLDRGASRAGRAGTAGHAVHRAAHPHSTALAMRRHASAQRRHSSAQLRQWSVSGLSHSAAQASHRTSTRLTRTFTAAATSTGISVSSSSSAAILFWR